MLHLFLSSFRISPLILCFFYNIPCCPLKHARRIAHVTVFFYCNRSVFLQGMTEKVISQLFQFQLVITGVLWMPVQNGRDLDLPCQLIEASWWSMGHKRRDFSDCRSSINSRAKSYSQSTIHNTWSPCAISFLEIEGLGAVNWQHHFGL